VIYVTNSHQHVMMCFRKTTTFISFTKYVLMGNHPDQIDHSELEKSKVHIIVEIIEYMSNAVVSKTIIKKVTGNVTVSSLDAGEEVAEKTSPYDTFVQVIDGTAELTIRDRSYKLRLGEGIIVPGHVKHRFNAAVPFKMLATVIKSGYED